MPFGYVSWLPVLLYVGLLPPCVSATWRHQKVDTRDSFFEFSMALDAFGNPAMAFGGIDGAIRLAVRDGSSWAIQTVDEGDCDPGAPVLAWPSLAFDAGGRPAVSYYVDDGLRFASWDGAAWRIEVVEGVHAVGTSSSLAFDDLGNPAICYDDRSDRENPKLKFAHRDGSDWETMTVGRGGLGSLSFDAAGNPAISFGAPDGNGLKLARWNGSGWDMQWVDRNVSFSWSSLAFDAAGNPTISYRCERPHELRFARWNGTSWDVEIVDTLWTHPPVYDWSEMLALDGAGNPAIVYSSVGLRFARWTGTGWDIETMPAPPHDAAAVSLAFDSGGRAAIGYLLGGQLRLVRWNGSNWDSETVRFTRGPLESHGGKSLVLDRNENPAICYEDVQGRELWFARWSGSSWQLEKLDDIGPLEGGVSLAFDRSGNAACSYTIRSAAGGFLRFARWSGSGWDIETVAGAVRGSSLAFDRAGNPAISFADGPLMLARWDGSSWNIEEVDVTGMDSSLGFDREGNPAIGYYDEHERLRLARWNGSSWERETVDSNLGTPCITVCAPSLALDGAGNLGIAYTRGMHVEFAIWRDSFGWTRRGLGDGSPERDPSLVFDSTGYPAISYGGWNGELKLVRWTGWSWIPETVVDGHDVGIESSLALDSAGGPLITYVECGDLAIASRPTALTLHRGRTGFPAPGWKSTALPLAEFNDDETPPFPVPGEHPGMVQDRALAPEPLVLYRALRSGAVPAGNILRVVKHPDRVEVGF